MNELHTLDARVGKTAREALASTPSGVRPPVTHVCARGRKPVLVLSPRCHAHVMLHVVGYSITALYCFPSHVNRLATENFVEFLIIYGSKF